MLELWVLAGGRAEWGGKEGFLVVKRFVGLSEAEGPYAAGGYVGGVCIGP